MKPYDTPKSRSVYSLSYERVSHSQLNTGAPAANSSTPGRPMPSASHRCGLA